MPKQQDWLPPQALTDQGHERKVGVEIELAGLEPQKMLECVERHFGGSRKRHTSFEFTVPDSKLGKFKIELDASYLKTLGALFEQSPNIDDEYSLESIAKEILTKAAEQFVPWELITPPTTMAQLPLINELMNSLRQAGALGTRNSLRYAFGLHLNPELPDLTVETILRYFRAYLCLYDWLAHHDQVDFSRKLSSYISHFNKDYIQLVIDPDYQPSMEKLIEDYISFNPSRNRSMDMLPLFAFINEKLVRSKIKDPRIKGRPTLHYRMPNCDIDNPDWDLFHPWKAWLEVEKLAGNERKLKTVCDEYSEYLTTLLATYDNEWLQHTEDWLQLEPDFHAR